MCKYNIFTIKVLYCYDLSWPIFILLLWLDSQWPNTESSLLEGETSVSVLTLYNNISGAKYPWGGLIVFSLCPWSIAGVFTACSTCRNSTSSNSSRFTTLRQEVAKWNALPMLYICLGLRSNSEDPSDPSDRIQDGSGDCSVETMVLLVLYHLDLLCPLQWLQHTPQFYMLSREILFPHPTHMHAH